MESIAAAGPAFLLPANKTIVLIGLMGAGKSTIGKRLARVLDIPFYDSDNEIVEAAGCSISDIFEIHGENIFRDLERRVISKLVTNPPAIIATGGGAYMSEEIRNQLAKHSVSVWLKADLDVLVERVSRRNTRPLLEQGDKRTILKKLMDERYPVYAKADVVVNSDDGMHDRIVARIVEQLKEFGSEKHHHNTSSAK